ncbi:MAG: hypothetical protein ABIS50_00600 [Luteolibacter sp.]|uniref:hypothetical protein n=1 Tax=Luteolibacter sp. TaxID=1962973 RepID=UPI0032670DB4
MTEEEKQKPLILELRKLAGQIGEIEDAEPFPREADSENYDFQIKTGLATALNEIFDYDLQGLVHFFGYCLIQNSVEIDDRMACLLDSLVREAEDQLTKHDQESE